MPATAPSCQPLGPLPKRSWQSREWPSSLGWHPCSCYWWQASISFWSGSTPGLPILGQIYWQRRGYRLILLKEYVYSSKEKRYILPDAGVLCWAQPFKKVRRGHGWEWAWGLDLQLGKKTFLYAPCSGSLSSLEPIQKVWTKEETLCGKLDPIGIIH